MQVFTTHSLFLATQNNVFSIMLRSDKWKESVKRKATLKELPHGVAIFQVYKSFFLYLEALTNANVCGIHILADSIRCTCLGKKNVWAS